MFLIARRTPLPLNLAGSLSLNSRASCSPVEAPEGTLAEVIIPFSVSSLTLTVGFPLESRIS